MVEDLSYEEITDGISEIANMLGVGIHGLLSGFDDLYAAQTLLTERLDGHSEIAERIVTLAQKMAEGKHPQREINKLRRRVEALDLPIETAPASPSAEVVSNANEPFARRTALARSRLPKTGGWFADWKPGTISRGPRNIKH